MHNIANNFPVGTSRADAFATVTDEAAAAWVHHNGDRTLRFAWDPHHAFGPKATLMSLSNGPHFFAREWQRLFVREVVARSRMFATLPPDVLVYIVAQMKPTTR